MLAVFVAFSFILVSCIASWSWNRNMHLLCEHSGGQQLTLQGTCRFFAIFLTSVLENHERSERSLKYMRFVLKSEDYPTNFRGTAQNSNSSFESMRHQSPSDRRISLLWNELWNPRVSKAGCRNTKSPVNRFLFQRGFEWIHRADFHVKGWDLRKGSPWITGGTARWCVCSGSGRATLN